MKLKLPTNWWKTWENLAILASIRKILFSYEIVTLCKAYSSSINYVVKKQFQHFMRYKINYMPVFPKVYVCVSLCVYECVSVSVRLLFSERYTYLFVLYNNSLIS